MTSRYQAIPSNAGSASQDSDPQVSDDVQYVSDAQSSSRVGRPRYAVIFSVVVLLLLGTFGLLAGSNSASNGGLPAHFADESYADHSDQTVPLTSKQQKSVTHQAKKSLKRLLAEPTSAPLMCRVDVMILRHCERGDVLSHCTAEGFERAKFLATQFGAGDERWPMPDFLIARSPEGKKLVEREIETLVPLSAKSGVRINAEGNEIKNKLDLVEDIFAHVRSGAACNTLTVISWKHENIPKLARKLGCGPKQGCPERYPPESFGDIWNIRYLYSEPEYPTKKMRKPSKVQPTWAISGFVLEEDFDIVAWDKQQLALGINSGDYSKEYLPGDREEVPELDEAGEETDDKEGGNPMRASNHHSRFERNNH